jgi:hypothetical protein
MEHDETLGGIEGFADRFQRATGRSVAQAAGLERRARRADRRSSSRAAGSPGPVKRSH